MEPWEHLLGSKSQLIFGQKFEIMLDIINVFWVIWLDIVLNTSFFGAFRASFRIKITLDYRTKKSKWCLILKAHLGADGSFFSSLFIIEFTIDWLLFFGILFLVFYPENGFSVQKAKKNWKSKNGVKTALTPLFKELWTIFGFVKFKNQISPPPPEKSKKIRWFANFL